MGAKNSPTRPLPGQIKRETPNSMSVDKKRGGDMSSFSSPFGGNPLSRGGGDNYNGDPATSSSSYSTTNGSTPSQDSKQKPGFVSALLSGRTPVSFGGSSSSNISTTTGEESTEKEAGATSSGYSVGGDNDDTNGTPVAARKSYHETQYDDVVNRDNVDLTKLRTLSWQGIPAHYRPLAWQLMLGYLPSNRTRREAAILKKRKEYQESVRLYFEDMGVEAGSNLYGSRDGADVSLSELGGQRRTQEELKLHSQILKDLPRTTPELPFFHHAAIQTMMERILYIWSLRHPASGYVQGMNDLLTPLLLVAAQPYIANDTRVARPSSGSASSTILGPAAMPRHHYVIGATTDVLRFDVMTLNREACDEIEADSYWMFSKLLDNLQDHYTFSQPGLQRMVMRLEDVTKRHCPELHTHLTNEGIMFMQFGFRWMNCVLLREVPLRCVVRLWDTYFAEERSGFENFHVYVCVVLLKMHEEALLEMDFQEIIIFLQDLPTGNWTDADIDPILSQAFILSTLYDQSGHL
jgi:hypothetical protein